MESLADSLLGVFAWGHRNRGWLQWILYGVVLGGLGIEAFRTGLADRRLLVRPVAMARAMLLAGLILSVILAGSGTWRLAAAAYGMAVAGAAWVIASNPRRGTSPRLPIR